MARFYQELLDDHKEFISKQHVFFVATAKKEGRVNLSPKGMDTFRVVDSNKIIWLNLTGSGNETAIHLQENDRMTIMFCSFDKRPLILRLYGIAKAHHKGEDHYAKYINEFPVDSGARQIMEMNVKSVQTSCGYAVPFMEYVDDREALRLSAKKKGEDGIKASWYERNHKSIDGDSSDRFS